MFERFTKGARAVVKGAVGHAERGGAAVVTEEHLLLALLDQEDTRAAAALRELCPQDRRASLVATLSDARRRAGLSRADADALADLGIDLGAIVARVEETHGAGALAGDRKDAGWWSGRRSFTREAKTVLEKSLRVALARRDREIGDEHILLALTTTGGVVAEALADHGVTFASVDAEVSRPAVP
ncbi:MULTISPECIES: Clp protease N-terminal domain-containing protein [Streptomyces]|uniref:Clp protease N-terminal domain-containing protein n=1 Tax=Streptomyces solicathayae TaxID=3081768 RepID=A0ABZ0LRZ1_9ACTN|nr:Clp protease N-terminal domain-containing protein [Streptomyces sp. HUAS YS2]WOX22110.1 Clp protease N-terminal domain-containing protein [Streptomyces sp. HUAS YS2]